MGKSVKFKNGRQTEWCSLHNSNSRSNEKFYRQKSGSNSKDTFTFVDGKKSEKHETYAVDSTIVDCKSCCCNGKVEKYFNESKVEYSPPPGIGFNFSVCHLPLSHQADGFQLLVDLGPFEHFIDPELIRGVESRMLGYTKINPPMEIRAAADKTIFGTA